jgi:hypothetical protein
MPMGRKLLKVMNGSIMEQHQGHTLDLQDSSSKYVFHHKSDLGDSTI